MYSFYLNERMMQIRVEEAHRQAELRRLQKQVGAGRTSWLARQRARSLNWLGCSLVSLGQQLIQSISLPPPRTEDPAGRGA